MPCVYIETPEEIAASNKSGIVHNQEYIKIRKELDRVTNFLCKIMSYLEDDNFKETDTFDLGLVFNNQDLKSWWKEHKEMDKKRRYVQTKERALSKLTKEEKKVLGLI